MSRAAQQSLGERDVTTTADRVAVIEATAATNLAETRSLVRALSSPALDAGLTTALRELCADTAGRSDAAGQPLSCQFRCEAEPPTLPLQHQAVLLRAAQSLLANVSEHSRARTAVVTLASWPDAVSLDIFDNGQGFSPQSLRHNSGDRFGLASLRDRVRELNGTVTVESAPGNGTVVAVRLPVTVSSGGRDER